MREPYPTWDEAFDKSYPVLEFNRMALYCNGIPVEVLRSLTDEEMQTICNLLISWLDTPRFTDAIRWIANAYLTGKGWEWEYDTQTDEEFITRRPPEQTGGAADGTLD